MMLFRRGRLSNKKSWTLLVDLFDHRYQWPLREPIIRFLIRGDALRFVCTLRFLIDRVGEGIYLLNRKSPPQGTPWFGADLEGTLAALPVRPAEVAARLSSIMLLSDPAAADLALRRLLLEIIDLAPTIRKRRRDEEGPIVPWLPRIAALDTATAPSAPAASPPGELRRIAQRAIRIVWRLPGSRLAALTGSVAAGYADLHSDVDISLLGLKFADPDVRRSLIAATSDAPEDITQRTTATYAADAFWLEDRLVDVRYFLLEHARRLIAEPVPQSREDYELLARLSNADILVDYEFRGPDLVRDLQRATRRSRSDRVARTAAQLEVAIQRLGESHDTPAIFYTSVEAILSLFQLLAARNDRWIVLPKRTPDWLGGLTYAPADIYERLRQVALLPCGPENVPDKVKGLRDLADEVNHL
jgi:predicted nucleotidyltransferase